VGFGALNAAPVTIGCDIQGRSFQGMLEQVQIYNTLLTPAQVSAQYSNRTLGNAGPLPTVIPGLVSWYQGQGKGQDSTGVNNGTVHGGVSYTAGVGGDQAFSFNGQGSYIDLGTGPDVVGTGAFAVAVWVRTTASGGMILNQRAANNYNGEYVLSLNGGKVN